MIILLQFAAGFVLLLFGAQYLLRGAVSLAQRLNISPMVIGMTIVSWGTTAPELTVSLKAALAGAPGIAVGSIVGSNITNILLVLGASAAIFPIVVKPRDLYRDAAVLMGSALLFTALALSGIIERWQGVLMVAALVVFSLYTFATERRRGKSEGPGELAEEFKEVPQALWLAALSVAGGLLAIIFGADLLINASIATAQILGVGNEVIALTVVAVGTSLPELTTAIVAAHRRNSDVALGNVIGSNIYNVLGTIGIVSAIAPVRMPEQILVFDVWWLLATTFAMLVVVLMRGGLPRWSGIVFLVGFAGYIFVQYYGVTNVMP